MSDAARLAARQSEPIHLAINQLDDFVFGHAPRPVRCGHGLALGTGTIIPEINFTLPTMAVDDTTWPEVRRLYHDMIEGVLRRAVELRVPGLLVEFETLPVMTSRPAWGLEIVELLAAALRACHDRHGLPVALRFTPNDTRDFKAPPQLRHGEYWASMQQSFEAAAGAGADLLSIESTGGKEVCDEALRYGDLRGLIFGLSVLGARDMEFLWGNLVATCRRTGIVAAGDTACAFGNTAMVLADQNLIPRVLAAIVRVASVPRSLVAYRMGATGPSKDCAYEGPYLKAIAGVPISMEGRSSACAHLTNLGNIAQAVCDSWSNESVQYVRLLSAYAPTVSMEQLAYDCRLLNVAAARSKADALRMRDLLVDSDAGLDPQAWVLRPDVVLRIAAEIVRAGSPYLQTRAAAHGAARELAEAVSAGRLTLPPREARWLDKLRREIDRLPDDEDALTDELMRGPYAARFSPDEYGLRAPAAEPAQ